jgi:hypothetical protein
MFAGDIRYLLTNRATYLLNIIHKTYKAMHTKYNAQNDVWRKNETYSY